MKRNLLETWRQPHSGLNVGTGLSLSLSLGLGLGLLSSGGVVAQSDLLSSASAASVATANPMQELQVLAVTLTVYETPSKNGVALAQIYRGNLFTVLAQNDNWFKVRLESQLTGWVLRAPDEYGQSTIEIFPAKGRTQIATAGTEDSAQPGAETQSGQFQGNGFEDSPLSVRTARPGIPPIAVNLPSIDPEQVPIPAANLPRDSIPVPDRWRLMQALGLVKKSLIDPYNQNVLKGDLPVFQNILGPDYFVNISAISDSIFEFRRLPVPVGNQLSARPGANDVLGNGRAQTFIHNAILSFALIKGDTTFRPQDIEYRFTPVINYNKTQVEEVGLLRADPSSGTGRTDNFIGVQELFIDYHLRNVSDQFDFDSVRVGIQPFTNDFRGFLFNDSPIGIRFFGNRDNNKFQYNLAVFRRMEKDTNSGLNKISEAPRQDDLFIANLFRQDWPVLGFTSQVSLVHNRNREDENRFDTNGFLVRPALVGNVRPHRYNVTYLGYTGDGHFGKLNLSTSTYVALGQDQHNPIAQRKQRIRAGFFAAEVSRDFDSLRLRGNFLVASGDKNPFDGKATGFDAIFENPIFAGSDTSFFIRQAIPLIGGGGVTLSGNNSILPSLRSSKNEGQSNFVNPGIALIGLGADLDIKPELRVFTNVSYLRFLNTSSLELLRDQIIPSRSIGYDFSVGFHYRPFFTQNIIINGSAAALKPTKSLKSLFGEDQTLYYSIVLNAIFTF
jgi:hypothetical protein